MALRIFVDSADNEWQVFDVVPRANERRSYDRRQLTKRESIENERRDRDRRLTVGGSGGIAGARGWLCFEHGDERRRLSPIPDDWTRANDALLEAYCAAARPVRQSRGLRDDAVRDGGNESAAVNPRR